MLHICHIILHRHTRTQPHYTTRTCYTHASHVTYISHAIQYMLQYVQASPTPYTQIAAPITYIHTLYSPCMHTFHTFHTLHPHHTTHSCNYTHTHTTILPPHPYTTPQTLHAMLHTYSLCMRHAHHLETQHYVFTCHPMYKARITPHACNTHHIYTNQQISYGYIRLTCHTCMLCNASHITPLILHMHITHVASVMHVLLHDKHNTHAIHTPYVHHRRYTQHLPQSPQTTQVTHITIYHNTNTNHIIHSTYATHKCLP